MKEQKKEHCIGLFKKHSADKLKQAFQAGFQIHSPNKGPKYTSRNRLIKAAALSAPLSYGRATLNEIFA